MYDFWIDYYIFIYIWDLTKIRAWYICICLFILVTPSVYIYHFLSIKFDSKLHFFLQNSDAEASIMLSNSWLYHYYSVQSKLQYGMAYDTQLQNYYHPSLANYSPSPYAINQESPYSQHSNEDMSHHMISTSEQQHHDIHALHTSRQHTPTVLRHSGGHIMAVNHQGYGFEPSMAERGPVDYSRNSSFTPDAERSVKRLNKYIL